MRVRPSACVHTGIAYIHVWAIYMHASSSFTSPTFSSVSPISLSEMSVSLLLSYKTLDIYKLYYTLFFLLLNTVRSVAVQERSARAYG